MSFWFSLGFYVINNGILTRWTGRWGFWVDTNNLWHVGSTALLGALWLLCARGPQSAVVLAFVDALGPFVALSGFAMMGVTAVVQPESPFTVLLAYMQISGFRATLIPSSARRTLAVNGVAAIPVILGVHATHRVLYGAEAGYMTVYKMLWCGVAAGMAAIISHVIYRLQQEVREKSKLGQYELGEKIGEGGMGAVYRAKHAMLRRPTAIKLLRSDRAGEASLARFEREVQLTSALTHPNTVAIYDYGRTPEGVFYYAMEYLDGQNLEELVEAEGPQPPARVLHVLRQVLGALGEAHGVGLVHRDIKPANIILCERGGLLDVAKVVDFGLVKDLNQDGNRKSPPGAKGPSALTGTPLYMPPEAVTAPESYDARGDLYALGAVGYFLLTGRHVFEAATTVEVLSNHIHTRPVPPSERLRRAVPADLERLLLACLEKDPERRPPTAVALESMLAGCADSGSWTQSDARALALHPRATRPAPRSGGETVAIEPRSRGAA